MVLTDCPGGCRRAVAFKPRNAGQETRCGCAVGDSGVAGSPVSAGWDGYQDLAARDDLKAAQAGGLERH